METYLISKILPSQLSDQEILDLLESDSVIDIKTAEIFDYNNDIVPFLSFYNITPGTTPVSKKLLYKLYKTYSKNPVDRLEFVTKVGVYIKHNHHYFSLNIDQFAISKHIYETEKTRDKTKSQTYQKHFDWFLTEAGVQPGNNWIEGFILYYIYKDFCRSRRIKHKFGYNNFHKFLKLHFEYKRLKENRSLWFKVNDETTNIFSKEEQDAIRKARTEKEGRSQEKSSGKSEETQT